MESLNYYKIMRGQGKSREEALRVLDARSRDNSRTPMQLSLIHIYMRGEVIGINAAKYSSTSVEGMGYAIPISKAQDIINELMNKRTRTEIEESKQGYLGIQGQNIDETAASMYGMPRGIYVYKIIEGGAAANSDLREKDIITKFDGQTVRTLSLIHISFRRRFTLGH